MFSGIAKCYCTSKIAALFPPRVAVLMYKLLIISYPITQLPHVAQIPHSSGQFKAKQSIVVYTSAETV